MIEGITYYVEGEQGLIPYEYNEIVHDINNGTIDLSKDVTVYDNYTRDKKTVKAKELL